MTVIDWDQWRTDYDRLTFHDQQDFYTRVLERHPEQSSFDLAAIHSAFDVIGGEDLLVHELGGWDGRLARDMLARDDIARWVNFDIADVPQVCTIPGYRFEHLVAPYWRYVTRADVFVACHTIEHLKARELESLFDALTADWVYLEAPLDDGPRDWAGYPGSHILEIGWDDVNQLLENHGFYPVSPGLWAQT